MDNETIAVPVLVFSPNYDSIEFISDSGLLSVTNKLGLKKGIVIGNFVVDSLGRVYETISAKKRGNYYPFWKFEFLNPLIHIELEVKKLREEFDLSELKDKVLKIITRDTEEWTNYGDVKEIKKLIQGSRTHGELIGIFGNYVHPLSEK